jgi:hypothetical protein
LAAALIQPDVRAVLPRMPEPLITQDGTAKHAGARHAATRCMAKGRQDPPHLTGMVTEDRVRSHAPPIETRHASGGHASLGGTAGEHASVVTQVHTAEHAGRVTYAARHDRATGVVHRGHGVHDVPLTASRADGRVHGLEYGESGQDQVQPCRWVTDVRVSQRHVDTRMRGGRARWKSAHAPCKTLKQQGDTGEQNYGHGEQHLSVVCATLRLLACLVDHTQPLCAALFQAVWAT